MTGNINVINATMKLLWAGYTEDKAGEKEEIQHNFSVKYAQRHDLIKKPKLKAVYVPVDLEHLENNRKLKVRPLGSGKLCMGKVQIAVFHYMLVKLKKYSNSECHTLGKNIN